VNLEAAVMALSAELARLREATRWTSVAEAMPVRRGVLVARTLPEDPMFGDRDVTIGYPSLIGWRDDHGPIEGDGVVVTHWMPIPAPPTPHPAGGTATASGAN
jgi:hypothetical protein